ncbi:MAG: lytic transglycosylase domain-containing protein [Bacteroidaceae bacterium]|nr:lytic transglycosylase domain-containing protein [Bacteroidaceae bacterium]
MRERLDRELIAFTYSHSISILMLKRSTRYFPQVEPILRAQGLPDDLKYLMVIESNLEPQSLSSASAAGLWQFTPSTAKAYGLEVNSNIDERYNTDKATEAACRYLKDAYEKYGDWLTVAASYNAGQNGISAKLDQQHVTRAVDLWLANETSRYMFRLLVVKMMFENPAMFGFHLSEDEYYPYIPAKDTVYVTESVPDLVKFAEDHGVSYARLKESNLWLRESRLNDSSHRTYKVLIPGRLPY